MAFAGRARASSHGGCCCCCCNFQQQNNNNAKRRRGTFALWSDSFLSSPLGACDQAPGGQRSPGRTLPTPGRILVERLEKGCQILNDSEHDELERFSSDSARPLGSGRTVQEALLREVFESPRPARKPSSPRSTNETLGCSLPPKSSAAAKDNKKSIQAKAKKEKEKRKIDDDETVGWLALGAGERGVRLA